MGVLTIIIAAVLGVSLIMIAIAYSVISKKMQKDTTIEEYFTLVKGFWAQIFGMFFSVSPDSDDDTVVAIRNIAPYLRSLLKELPIDAYEGTHQGEPVLFVRSHTLAQVTKAIHSEARKGQSINPLYDVVDTIQVSTTVRWIDLMYQFWRNAVRITSTTPEQLLEARRGYQAMLGKYTEQVKEFVKATTEEQDELNNYLPWAQKLYGELKSHPDILRVSLTEKPGMIVVYTDDLTVTETGTKVKDSKPRQWLLGKMMIYINITTGETSYRHENGHMKGSDHQAPHVGGHVCWGTHTDVISRAIGSKNFLLAIQEAMNFVQYANTADPWGATATGLDRLSQKQVEALQERKLARVADMQLQTNSQTVSTTSFYIVKDTKEHRKVCKELGIEIVLDLEDPTDYGITGLLLSGKDINSFLKATLEEGLTIRTDPTIQNAVRQITFIPDKEQKSFVDLLVSAWKANRTKIPQSAGQTLKSIQKDLMQARKKYVQLLLSEHKQQAKLTNEFLDTGGMNSAFEEMYRALLRIPEVESVNWSENMLTITTVDLSMEYKRPHAYKPTFFALGPVNIIIDLTLDQPVRIERVRGKIPNTQFMTPNVIGDGTPLWGIKELQLMQLFAKGQYTALVQECLAFLSALKDNTLGKYTDHLPEMKQVIDLEEFRTARQQVIDKRLIELPTLMSIEQPSSETTDEMYNKLLNQ